MCLCGDTECRSCGTAQGTYQPAPDRLRADAANLWRRQAECGCAVVGGGTVSDPLRVEHCEMHEAEPDDATIAATAFCYELLDEIAEERQSRPRIRWTKELDEQQRAREAAAS